MNTIIRWRSSSVFGPRGLLLGFAVGLAAVLLPAAGAFAQVENQKQIDQAVKAYEDSTKEAVENIPDSEVMKRREDELDRHARDKTDADAAQKAAEATGEAGKIDTAKKAATKAGELEETYRILADNARAYETSEADKERAQKYREALEKRRAARLAMKKLESELKPKVDDRRALSADKELDNEIVRLRTRIGRAEQPITSKTVASLIPFWPMTANVSSDSQTHCTYGKASPASVALEPSDADGNPLVVQPDPRLALALALLRVATTPMPIGNPDGAPQQGPPKDGGGSHTPPAGAPSAPNAGPPAAKSPQTPATTPSAATPKRPADTGILGSKFNGEFPEDVIDRFSKLAEEALAQGDKVNFARHREKVREAAQWVVNRTSSAPVLGGGDIPAQWRTYLKEVSGWGFLPTTPSPPGLTLESVSKLPNGQTPRDAIDGLSILAEEALSRGDKKNFESYRNALEAIVRWAMKDLESKAGQSLFADWSIKQWRTYEKDVSGWQFDSGPASAEAAGGKPDAKQTPPADAKPADPAVTPPRTATPGEKSAPAPEKSTATEKTDAGDKGTTPEKSKSTEKAETGDKPATPPSPPSDAAMPGPAGPAIVTIHFKVTESALQEGAQAPELVGQMAKLTMPEPALPKPGRTRTAKDDVGHETAPVTCVAGSDGCKAKLTGKEMKDFQALYRELLKQPAATSAAGSSVAAGDVADSADDFVPAENYRVDVAMAKTTGAVIRKPETQFTPAQLAALKEMPKGVEMVKSPFKVGDRTLTRVGLAGPDALTAKVMERLRELFGPDVRIDLCIDKQPGPPLGMTPVSLSALNSELPEATLGIAPNLRTPRAVARR